MSIGRVNQNLMAMTAYRNLSVTQNALSTNVRRFSTGLKIESAKDDATGLAISERFRSQIKGYETANQNAQDANNMLQVADGALNESHSILQRLRQLAITSANEATTNADRKNIQTEVNQLLDELDTIAGTTQYNGRTLMNGDLEGSSAATDAKLQIARNVNVSVSSVQGSENKQLINSDSTKVVSTNNQDVTFEIRLVASATTADGVDALIYASNSVDANGELALVQTVSDVTSDKSVAVTGYSATIAINASNADDIGKSAMVRLQSKVDAVTGDNSLSFQVRANQGQSISMSLGDMSTQGLRIKTLDVSNRLAGQNAIGMLDDAIQKVSTQRANVGALQQRISSTISSNELNIINQTSAESRIRDVDFAQETLSFTRNNILVQSGTAVLAQANAAPQSVLSLIG